MITLSSNGFSHDLQVQDVMNYLRLNDVANYVAIKREFPENMIFADRSSQLDTEAMGVDIEWSCWLTDKIEQDTNVEWWEGEPVIMEDGDRDDDDMEDDSE